MNIIQASLKSRRFVFRIGWLLLSCLNFSLQGAPSPNHSHSLPRYKPALKWKYGWQDGALCNTIGSVLQNNPSPKANAAPGSGYSPSQIASAYKVDQIAANGDGRGQVIAIVVAYGSPTIQADLNKFCAQYGIPSTTVSLVYPRRLLVARD